MATFFLHMIRPASSNPVQLPEVLRFAGGSRLSSDLYRTFYLEVGGPWDWRTRKDWTLDQISELLQAPDVEVCVLYEQDIPAGFVEYEWAGDEASIRYLGLRPRWQGRGLGGPLLDAAISHAWAQGARCLMLKTSTTDHPTALPLYLRHGFQVRRVDG